MRCLLVLLLVLGCVSPLWAAPEMIFDQLNYDFGEILQGEQVEFVYRFRNAGDEVLQLGNVRSSCGCTAAKLSATRIAPGDTGELRATFDSTRFKGGIHKTISVDTNDPRHPNLAFAISGNIKVELQVVPERLNWGRVKVGTPLDGVVRITNGGAQPINLQAPKVTNPAVKAELSKLQLPPGQAVEVKISAVFPEQKNRLNGYVIIDTDYPKVAQIRISVSARLAK